MKWLMYFMWYWFDKEELTEHGGSVPGWLTKKGLGMLNKLNKQCGGTGKYLL